MGAGIALLDAVGATLESWLIKRVAGANEEDEAAARAQVSELRA
jgi:hypothetical protein